MNEPGIATSQFIPFDGITAFNDDWKYSLGLNKSNMGLEILPYNLFCPKNFFYHFFYSWSPGDEFSWLSFILECLFHLHAWRIFSLNLEFSSFNTLSIKMLFHCLWHPECLCIVIWIIVSLIWSVLFFFGCLQKFFLVFGLQQRPQLLLSFSCSWIYRFNSFNV